MGKATGKTAAAAKKGEAKTETPAEKGKKAEPKVLATVKASALSIEVGPKVLGILDKTFKDEAKANEMLGEIKAKRFDALAMTTEAIVKAAKADDSINLAATFSGDTKQMNILNDQLGLALGFREKIEVVDGKGEKSFKIATAKGVVKYFPGPKEDKKSVEYQRKNTFRSNFLHLVKKCAQAAHAIIEKDMKISIDKDTGTLQIAGPEVKKVFGQDSVLLNDKLTIGEGENVTTLKAKPSFTAIAKLGAEAEGQTLTTRKDSRVASGAVNPQTAIQSIAHSLVQALSKLSEKPDAKTIEALEAVYSAVDKVLPKE